MTKTFYTYEILNKNVTKYYTQLLQLAGFCPTDRTYQPYHQGQVPLLWLYVQVLI